MLFWALSPSGLCKAEKGGGSILIGLRLFGIYTIEARGVSEFLLNRALRKGVDLLKDGISVQEGCVFRTFHYIIGLKWINKTQAFFFLENCCLHHFFSITDASVTALTERFPLLLSVQEVNYSIVSPDQEID